MHCNLEDAGEATRAETPSPTTTTLPSTTNPSGPTAIQLRWHLRCQRPRSFLLHTLIPKPRGAAGSSTDRPYMDNNSDADFDPWNDEPTEEIITGRSTTTSRSFEYVDVGVGACGAEHAEQRGPCGRSQGSADNDSCMGGNLQHPPGQRPNSYYMAIHPNNPMITPVIGLTRPTCHRTSLSCGVGWPRCHRPIRPESCRRTPQTSHLPRLRTNQSSRHRDLRRTDV